MVEDKAAKHVPESVEWKKTISSLINRMPQKQIVETCSQLIVLADEQAKNQMKTDTSRLGICPLKVSIDTIEDDKEFLQHEFNRSGESSYRSPWSNKYFPEIETEDYPSLGLQTMEKLANHLFETYVYQYYDIAISSVYLKDPEPSKTSFNACFLVKKELKDESGVKHGCWDGTHTVQIMSSQGDVHNQIPSDQTVFTYTMQSAVYLAIDADRDEFGSLEMTGSWTRDSKKENIPLLVETQTEIEQFHVKNMGMMLQENER